jgi:hypothetical protein
MFKEPTDGNNGKNGEMVNIEELARKKDLLARKGRINQEDLREPTENEKKKIGVLLWKYENEFISGIEPEALALIEELKRQDLLIAGNYARYREYLTQNPEYRKKAFSEEEIKNFENAIEMEAGGGSITHYINSLFSLLKDWNRDFFELLNQMKEVDENNTLKRSLMECRDKTWLNKDDFEKETDNSKKLKVLGDFIDKNKKT